jgi:CBS domain-containing protein
MDTAQVRDFMTTDLLRLTPGMGILDAVELLQKYDVSGAPVVDDKGGLVGILTTKDCLKAALNAAYYEELGGNVAEYMAPDPRCVSPDLSLVDMAKQFYSEHYLRYPVVQNDDLIGIISRSDIMKAISHFWR